MTSHSTRSWNRLACSAVVAVSGICGMGTVAHAAASTLQVPADNGTPGNRIIENLQKGPVCRLGQNATAALKDQRSRSGQRVIQVMVRNTGASGCYVPLQPVLSLQDAKARQIGPNSASRTRLGLLVAPGRTVRAYVGITDPARLGKQCLRRPGNTLTLGWSSSDAVKLHTTTPVTGCSNANPSTAFMTSGVFNPVD